MPAEPPPTAATTPRRGVGWPVVLALGAVALAAAGVAVVALLITVGSSDVPAAAPPAPDAPVGASTDGYAVWEVNDDGTPVRWDPCTPIEIEVAPAGGPIAETALLRDLELAVADLRLATGLDLRVVGTTDEEPAADRPAYVERGGTGRWAPILVAWAAPGENDLPLRDVDRGIGTPVAVGEPGQRVYVTGQVVLNRDRDDLQAGRADRGVSWGATVLHELAHVLGLDHVDDRGQLMSTYPGSGPVQLGEGDLAGLAAVGADHGCLEVPEPRPVDVTVIGP